MQARAHRRRELKKLTYMHNACADHIDSMLCVTNCEKSVNKLKEGRKKTVELIT